jgi:predicted AlkP superfamily phosphohydrolase/phosphomutase
MEEDCTQCKGCENKITDRAYIFKNKPYCNNCMEEIYIVNIKQGEDFEEEKPDYKAKYEELEDKYMSVVNKYSNVVDRLVAQQDKLVKLAKWKVDALAGVPEE